MTESNFKNADLTGPLKLLGQVKKVDQLCKIHHVHMVQLQDKNPFCPVCQRLAIKKREKDLEIKATKYWTDRKAIMTLGEDSIFDDPSLKTASFDNFEKVSDEANTAWNSARHIAGQYLSDDAQFNTLFTGPPGRGKSHLAYSMLKAVNEHKQPATSCLFVSVNELFRLIKDSFNYPDSKYTEANMVNLLGNAGLLVLDDLGSESSFRQTTTEASEFVQRVLFGILNKRTRTIITTNLHSNELAKIYNDKILSRMNRGVRRHIITFTDKTPDRRGVEF